MTNSELVGKVILEGFARGNDVERVIENAESLGFKVSEEFILRHFKRIENHLKERRVQGHEIPTKQVTGNESISSPVRIKQTISRYTECL